MTPGLPGPTPMSGLCRSCADVRLIMERLWQICRAVHSAALGIWLGALLVAGASAAMIFPLAREIGPVLPSFAKYTGDHAILVGGMFAQRVFFAADVVQFVCATLAILTLGIIAILTLRRGRSMLVGARVAIFAITLCVFCWYFFMLTPGMQKALRLHYDAAQAGNNEAALQHKSAFDADHPRASTALSVIAGGVALSLVLSLWTDRSGKGAARGRADGVA